MEKAVTDLMQWCVEEAAQVVNNAQRRYGIELNKDEESRIAMAIFGAMGIAYGRGAAFNRDRKGE